MKSALNYYYNLNPTSIHQINKNYRCYINGENYFLTLFNKDNYGLDEVYELSVFLLQNKIPCHQIILNNNGEILTIINNLPYILLKVFVSNRSINIEDILFFSKLSVQDSKFKTLIKKNWYDMWMKKIDYFEYQISQFGKKYPIIRESFNYYIGLAETAISLLNNTKTIGFKKSTVSHTRIKKKDGIIDFYNPLNFILDNNVRDLSEFMKEQFFADDYSFEDAKIDIGKFTLTQDDYILFLSRMIFPTYYFDCYEEILNGAIKEEQILRIINKNSKYLEFLKNIYIYLKQFVNFPEIEWLIKM